MPPASEHPRIWLERARLWAFLRGFQEKHRLPKEHQGSFGYSTPDLTIVEILGWSLVALEATADQDAEKSPSLGK